jgi:hypothetical protein
MTVGARSEVRVIVRNAVLLVVTLLTRQREMFPDQGILRRIVRPGVERRPAESVYGMTGAAVPFVRPRRKLAIVQVPMTGDALREFDFRFEVRGLMAGGAVDGCVASGQWIAGSGVIESSG